MILSYANIIPYIIHQLSSSKQIDSKLRKLIDNRFIGENYVISNQNKNGIISKNCCFSVICEDSSSESNFFLKQPNTFSTSDTLSIEREYNFYDITNNKIYNIRKYLPELYDFNEASLILIFEYLKDPVTLKNRILNGEDIDNAMVTIGNALSQLHHDDQLKNAFKRLNVLFGSHYPSPIFNVDFSVSPEIQAKFQSDVMPYRNFIEGGFGTYLEIESDFLKKKIEEAKTIWVKNDDPSIIHGDFKTSNIIVLANNNVKIVDWEMTAFGSKSWDIACFLFTVLLNCIDCSNDVNQEKCLQLFCNFKKGYVNIINMEEVYVFLIIRIVIYYVEQSSNSATNIECRILPNIMYQLESHTFWVR